MNFHIHPDVFTPRECAEIVRLGFEQIRLERSGTVAGVEGVEDVSADIRESRVAWIGESGDDNWIHERLAAVAEAANDGYGFDLDGFSEDLQFTVYESEGSHYTWHHDGFEEGLEHRKLSLVIQLSDPSGYEGADLEFLEVAEDYDSQERDGYLLSARAIGSVISFPAFEYHRVTPLISGLRCSLVSWLSGPPFR